MPDGSCAITAFGMPFSRMSAVSARVSMPGKPDDAAAFQPGVEIARGAIVGRGRDCGMQHDAARAGRRREVDGLDIFLVGADIADMGKCEGDDLAGIGRIGEDLLITGHGGIEADFADGMAGCAEANTFEHGAVRQNEKRRRLRLVPAGQRL